MKLGDSHYGLDIFSLIFENFIFGNGYSGFDLLSYEFFGFIESPHNVLLEVFCILV